MTHAGGGTSRNDGSSMEARPKSRHHESLPHWIGVLRARIGENPMARLCTRTPNDATYKMSDRARRCPFNVQRSTHGHTDRWERARAHCQVPEGEQKPVSGDNRCNIRTFDHDRSSGVRNATYLNRKDSEDPFDGLTRNVRVPELRCQNMVLTHVRAALSSPS